MGGLKTPKKKVAKYNDEGILMETYNSVQEAGEKNNIFSNHVSMIANDKGSMKRVKKFRYRFFTDFPQDHIEKYSHELSKKVAKYDRYDKLIEIYDSVSNASEKTGIKKENISAAALGKIKTAGNHVWRYINADLSV